MSETVLLGEAGVIPASLEVQEYEARVGAAAAATGATAVEEIMRTDEAAAFEWPAGKSGNRGVTYTAPSGDA